MSKQWEKILGEARPEGGPGKIEGYLTLSGVLNQFSTGHHDGDCRQPQFMSIYGGSPGATAKVRLESESEVDLR